MPKRLSRRSRALLSGGVLILASLAVAWAWSARQQPGSGGPATAPAEATFVIRYDGVSFQPSRIKVSPGTTVYFVNESDELRPMYVASDDHPTHEKYPGFDAAAARQKFPALGESFSFTMERPGTWGFHDHNFPVARGTIIVEQE